ncbi:MAG: hypothetical protein IT186_22795 [Acidobacteria bacterium]|nr:hypothetical protein [Acidobacteriota bacterium]
MRETRKGALGPFLGVLLPLSCLLVAGPASAQSLPETFHINVGGFFQNYESNVAYGTNFKGTPIDLEKDLGLGDNSTSLRVDGYWRMGKRSRLSFNYTGSNRSGDRVLSRDIVFGDRTFHAGATISGAFRVSLAEIYYGYSFVNQSNFELGAMIGVSSYVTTAELEGTATVTGSGGSTSWSFTSEAKSFVAPIPALGAYLRYSFTDSIGVSGQIRGLRGSVGDYYGSMSDFRAMLDWRFSKYVGIGGGYQYVRIRFEKTTEDQDIALTLNYEGPLGYLSFWF